MAESEEFERRQREEYQMQLFGLHSRTVFLAIIQKIQECVKTRCEKMCASIVKKYPQDNEKELIQNNLKLLRKTYQRNMQPHLKAIQNIVNKLVCVPSNVLLEEDKCQAIQYNDKEFYDLEKKLQDLQTQAKRVTIFNVTLKEELEIVEQIAESEKIAKGMCTIVNKALCAKKLNNNTLRAIEKCKQIKDSINLIKQETKKDVFNPRLNESELENVILNE